MTSGTPPTRDRTRRAGARVAFLLALIAASNGAADPGVSGPGWKFDTLRLKNGSVLSGVILEETPSHIRFQNVRRHPGRAMVVFTTLLSRSEIERCEKLSDADRQLLRGRLDEIESAADGERQRMDSLDLREAPWGGKPKAGLRYDSDHFSLVSDAAEEIVRRSAVRLEQIYTAYARFLPPRHKGGKPTTILLYASPEAYHKDLAGKGWKFLNPAFFDPAGNRIACASDLQRLGDDLQRVRREHRQLREELNRQEGELRRLYAKNKEELARHLTSIAEMRKLVDQTDRRNDGVFDRATRELFAVLYHEAFHAYVNGFVYPPAPANPSLENPGELPRWLNEGLAQIFETAIVEAGELRLGHAERDRLSRVKDLVRKGEMLPVRELLCPGRNRFIVVHGGDRFDSDRAYLASWALSFYLMFDRKVLGSAELDEFVRQVNSKGDPIAAFAKLTGQPLDRFDKDFQQFLLRLQPDGRLADVPPAK